MSSKVVGGLESPLLTGVDGLAEGVELLEPNGSDLKGGIDMRVWLLSEVALEDADLVTVDRANCELLLA
jgi:hypothetical protein